ncbi:MAG: hypothetical protein QHH15_01010 [Candidatus Thermoplasmatota archaeon]|nr:hypothetical protein [Candidatus Thermoplasmatota archaeon]
MDGDFLIAGTIHSFGPKGFNGWVIKSDENGNELWNVSFGGEKDDHIYFIIQSDNEGFVVAGKYQCEDGYDDAWLVKLGYVPFVSIVKPVNGLYFKNFLVRSFLF